MLKAVIQAGGKGTRLSAVTGDLIPKPMVDVAGKPLLLRQIETLRREGVSEFVIIVGHLGEQIEAYFGNGSDFGVKISYIKENSPLGSAGSLYALEGEKEDFFLVFGDTVFDIDLKRMADFHREKRAAITLFAHPNSHPYDSDVILTDGDGRVTGILPKNADRDFWYGNLVNAAFFIVSPKALGGLDGTKKDMEKDVISPRIASGDVFAYVSSEYIKDAGTEKRLASVTEDLLGGVVEARNLRNRQRCVFLDRDGTINKLNGFVSSPDMFELLPGVASAVRKINESGMLAVVVTNQPVIARGECTFDGLKEIHDKMETLLGEEGAYLDGIFFCPHHPDGGFPGEVRELKIRCDCRKPKTGMFLQAAERFNIDLSRSFMIGDSARDVEAGKNAGVVTVMIEGEGGEAEPDFRCKDLPEAVEKVVLPSLK